MSELSTVRQAKMAPYHSRDGEVVTVGLTHPRQDTGKHYLRFSNSSSALHGNETTARSSSTRGSLTHNNESSPLECVREPRE